MRTERFSTKMTLLLVSCLTVMAGATIAPALPSLQAHFADVKHAGFWIRLVLTLPALFIVMAAPLAGWFLDRNGRLRLLIPAMVLYGIAGSSGLYLDSIGSILAGRALLGVAVAGVMTSVTTLIADYYEGQARSKFMGLQAAFMNFGGVIFLTAGGGLTELGWRWPFSIYLFSIILIPLALFALDEPVQTKHKTGNHGENKASLSSSLKLLAFVYSVIFSGMAIFYFIPLHIPFHLKSMVGAGPAASGLAIAGINLFAMLTALNYRRIRNRIGYVPILALTFALMGAGFLMIGFGKGYLSVIAGLVTGGLGAGLLFPNLTVWLTTETPAAVRGRALGGYTTAIFLGQFMSPIIGQPIVERFGLGVLFWVSGTLLVGFSLVLVFFRQTILHFIRFEEQPSEVEQAVQSEPLPEEVAR